MSLDFDAPVMLLLLLALPLLLAWEFRESLRRPAVRLSSVGGVRALPRTWRQRLRWAPAALRIAALALIIIALARPQSGRADALVPQEGIDIVLILDTSQSMRTSASPTGESRLAVAQRVLRDFVAERERDRLGLVAFRSRSLVLSPLTVDYAAFQGLIDQADDIELPNGTAIGLAMTDALNLLRESKASSRIAILLSDGENNRPEVEPLDAAQIAETLGIRVYTVGVTSGGGGFQASPFAVNEEALRTIAELTGGRYYSADSPEQLAEVYDTIDDLERSRVGPERFSAFDELAPRFLLGALALIALQVALVTFVLRRVP